MKDDYSQEQIAEAKKILAKTHGSKGGRSGWDKLSEEEKKERIKKLNEARRAFLTLIIGKPT